MVRSFRTIWSLEYILKKVVTESGLTSKLFQIGAKDSKSQTHIWSESKNQVPSFERGSFSLWNAATCSAICCDKRGYWTSRLVNARTFNKL